MPDRDAAEDVAQEAVMRAWKAWNAGTRPDSMLAWILTITRREAARWRSSRAARCWHETAEPQAVDDASPDHGDLDVLSPIALRAALEQLSAPERMLVRLRYELDLPQRRVAELMATPEGTAKVRLHRVRQRLRVSLSA